MEQFWIPDGEPLLAVPNPITSRSDQNYTNTNIQELKEKQTYICLTVKKQKTMDWTTGLTEGNTAYQQDARKRPDGW